MIAFNVVGLPQGAVKEGRERVVACMQNSGFYVPPKRITVNLAPADLPKGGGRYLVRRHRPACRRAPIR